MKLLSKNKKGFTLIEMVLVVTILVILAAGVLTNVGEIYQRSQNKSASIDEAKKTVVAKFSSYESDLRRFGF